jgi:hypothetical protein
VSYSAKTTQTPPEPLSRASNVNSAGTSPLGSSHQLSTISFGAEDVGMER